MYTEKFKIKVVRESYINTNVKEVAKSHGISPSTLHRWRKDFGRNFDGFENLDWKIEVATDIVDKQYGLYSWADAKTSALITANSVLLAAIGFTIEKCLELTYSLAALLISFILVGLSIYFCLDQVIPQRSSGKSISSEPNIKALSGILKFEKWKDYYHSISMLQKDKYLEYLSRQIYGMANNVNKSRKKTTYGVRTTMLSIFFLMIAMAGMIFEEERPNENPKNSQKNIINVENEKNDKSLNLIDSITLKK